MLTEFVFSMAWLGLLYLLSGGYVQQFQIFVVLFSAGAAVKVLMLWIKLKGMSLKISNSHVFLNNYGCDITLWRSFLPYEVGSILKVSYSVGVMQKRNIYLPKGALSADDWKLISEHRI